MFSFHLFVLIVALANSTNARGIGKAWEVSPSQNPDHPSPLSSRPRLESSAFEVRSVFGIGRLAPSSVDHDKFAKNSPIDESTTEIPFSSATEKSEEPSAKSNTKSRLAKELDDLESANVFVPKIEFENPKIEDFFRRAKDVDEVEALPSMWRKFHRQGRTGRNHRLHCSEVEEIDEPSMNEERAEFFKEKPRLRRETETEMEKIAEKNMREPRLGSSSESWSKQPLSVEFRHRTKLGNPSEEEEKSMRSTDRGLHAPRVDFVTSNRRSFSESRESRDMPLPLASGRSYDEMPMYRNTRRDHDQEALYNRGLFYPERYRTERDYFVRSSNEPTYQQDRYRDVDFDIYGRNRPMPKPKRIIYYATLPEVVRKPVDLRSYPRPHDALMRSSNTAMSNDGYYKRRSGVNEPARYRYYAYPHGNYESYDRFAKRPGWNERPYLSYEERMEVARRREQDLDHASMTDNSRNEESMLELGHDRQMAERTKSREQDKLPWPVHIGTEVSVKENDRITGRKIFGHRDEYNRFRNNGRIDQNRDSSGSAEGRN